MRVSTDHSPGLKASSVDGVEAEASAPSARAVKEVSLSSLPLVFVVVRSSSLPNRRPGRASSAPANNRVRNPYRFTSRHLCAATSAPYSSGEGPFPNAEETAPSTQAMKSGCATCASPSGFARRAAR